MNFKDFESNKEFWSIWHGFAQKKGGHFLEFREFPSIWNVQEEQEESNQQTEELHNLSTQVVVIHVSNQNH